MKEINVLIVDDSPFQISMLRQILTENGFNVVGEAQSLEEVKQETARLKPDVVTMDMTIPGTDGFECTQAIHEIDSNIKVIIVSSMMDEELIRKAKKIRANGYIQKPVDPEELSLLINRLMADEELFIELEGLYKDIFKVSAVDLFNKLTKTVPLIEDEVDIEKEIKSKGIAIVMGIIGKYSGTMIFDMSNETAKKFATALLKAEPKNNEEQLNVIAEIANMLSGNACSMINKKNKLFGLRVAPPTILYGESINISKLEIEGGYAAKIKSDFGDILMHITFKRGEEQWMSII